MVKLITSLFSRVKKWTKKEFIKEYKEFSRISSLPRFSGGQTDLIGAQIKFSDSFSFLQAYTEIFKQKVYHFTTTSASPYIIDCGSNIGLSIIYFKSLYPQAQIVGFEPDPNLFEILKFNLKQFNITNVELHKKAILDSAQWVSFHSQGGSSGQVLTDGANTKGANNSVIEVEAVSLKPFLHTKVDFLKIDIEGAEYRVLESIKDSLHLVDKLFIEYHSFSDAPQNLSHLLEILHQANFRYYIYPAMEKDQPFQGVESMIGMDMQLNIYAIRK